MANSEEHMRAMLDQVNIGEEDKQFIMEQARQRRAYLTENAEEKAELMQAMKSRDVKSFR